MNNKNRNPSRTWLLGLASCAGILVIVLCVGALLFSAKRALFIFVEPNERGVVLSLNQPTGEILGPGYHLLRPSEQVLIFDIGRQTYIMSASSGQEPDFIEGATSDGQKIQVDISVTYAVDPEKLLELYTTWMDRYRDNLVRPMSRSITRNALAHYTFDEIVGTQAEIEKVIFDQLETTLTENYLVLVNFELLDVRPVNE